MLQYELQYFFSMYLDVILLALFNANSKLQKILIYLHAIFLYWYLMVKKCKEEFVKLVVKWFANTPA